MHQLVRCVSCNAIFMKTPFDQEPDYPLAPLSPQGVTEATERDDFKDFMRNHASHPLEDLTVMEDSCVSDKDYIEPVKLSYFRATNGKENFVIKKFREKIDEPLRYELIAGDYSLKCTSVEVQAREIEKQIAKEFTERPISKNKIDSFIRLFDHILGTVVARNLERIAEESSNPLEIYYKMDELMLMHLLRNCRYIFKGQEYLDIEKFVHRHKDDGVLLLKATFKIEVIERAKTKNNVLVATPSIEREKVSGMM